MKKKLKHPINYANLEIDFDRNGTEKFAFPYFGS